MICKKKVTGQHFKVSRFLRRLQTWKFGSVVALQVSLKDWIDRRIGGEVATKVAKNGQVPVAARTFGHWLWKTMKDELIPWMSFRDSLPPSSVTRFLLAFNCQFWFPPTRELLKILSKTHLWGGHLPSKWRGAGRALNRQYMLRS